MIFKDVNVGGLVYVLNRNEVSAFTAKIIKKSESYLNRMRGSMDMFVDLTLEFNGGTRTFGLKDGSEVGYTEEMLIATDAKYVIQEARSIVEQAESDIAKEAQNRERLTRGNDIIENFDPVVREKRESEERLSKLEGSLDEVKSILKGLVKDLKG